MWVPQESCRQVPEILAELRALRLDRVTGVPLFHTYMVGLCRVTKCTSTKQSKSPPGQCGRRSEAVDLLRRTHLTPGRTVDLSARLASSKTHQP